MLDFNPSSMARSVSVSEIHDLIEASTYRDEKRRTYVGASSIGGPCERRVQYEFMGVPHDEGWRHSARTLRIFQRGHVFEAMAATWLVDAGFKLTQTGKDGRPIGFKVAGGDYAGHVDRVCTCGPIETLAYPFVVEFKALGSKGWNAISNRGLKKAAPQYYGQVSQYQSYLNLTNPALFFAVNADTMQLHMELVPFDRARAQEISDKAVAIIADTKARAMRPRCTDDRTFYACSDCPFHKRCWDMSR